MNREIMSIAKNLLGLTKAVESSKDALQLARSEETKARSDILFSFSGQTLEEGDYHWVHDGIILGVRVTSLGSIHSLYVNEESDLEGVTTLSVVEEKPKVYISSSTLNLEKVLAYKDYISDTHEVVSTWHDHEPQHMTEVEHPEDVCKYDFMEIDSCKEFHCLDAIGSGGGMYSELGYAIALCKKVKVLGPSKKSLAHYHNDVEFVETSLWSNG